jgi:hypothetical protein
MTRGEDSQLIGIESSKKIKNNVCKKYRWSGI